MAISVSPQNRVDVSDLYVALFGRAPDGEGLGYWSNQLASGQTLAQVANAMFNTVPARAFYPSFQTNAEIINSFYSNVLGRTGDTEGAAYWTGQLNQPTATPGSVITQMIAAVKNFAPSGKPGDAASDAAGTISKNLFLNKESLALGYGLSNGSIEGASNALTGAANSINLTVAADTLNGTSGKDIFTANVLQNSLGAQVNSLGSGDKLNGGGGIDTLMAKITAGAYINGTGQVNYLTGQQFTMPIEPGTKSIEIVKLQAVESTIIGQNLFGEDGGNKNTQVYVNAKDMEDVTQMWSSRSDADLTIQSLTTKGLSSLSQQTLGMEYTGNKDSKWGASDYTVYYDQDYLTAGTARTDALEIRIVNNLELKVNNKGLVAFEKVSFLVGADLITVDISPAIRDLTGAAAYNALVVAIQTQLAVLKITGVTVSTLPVRTAVFTDDLIDNGFTFPRGSESGVYTPILLTSTAAPLGRGQAAVDNTTLNFNGLNTQLFATQSNDLLVTVNVALEKVGLAGDGGTFVAGSMNKTEENIWKAKNTVVGSTTSGIQDFEVSVGGNNTKSSSLAGMHSTNNNLKVVNVVSGVTDGTFANLTIGNSNTSGYATDIQYRDKSYEVDRPDLFNQYALKDVQTFNAAGLKGNLHLTAALTPEVTAKYLNVIDNAANPAADNVAFTYTSGVGNDYINLYLDPANLAQPGTVTREDMSLLISTGLGNDEVLVGTGVYSFNGEGGSGGTGPNWYENQHINANLKMVGGVATGQLLINTGAGNDIVRTLGFGDYAINAGDDLDTVYLDNTGGRAVWTINDVNSSPLTNLLSQPAVVAAPKIANLSLNVLFKGFDSKVFVGGSNGSLSGVSVTDLTINQAIKAAINLDPVLNKLLIAEDGPGRTLVITSLIDGVQQDANLFSDVVVSLSSTPLSAQQSAAAFALSPAQATALGFGVATTSGFGSTSGGRFDANLDTNGTISNAISDNLVVGGLGNDVLVLGTGVNSNDTVGYSGFNNGTDSIVNFSSQSTTTTVVDSATVFAFTQGSAGTAATPAAADTFTLKLTGTVAVPTPGTFTLANPYIGGGTDVVYSPTAGLTAAQVATNLAAATNAVLTANYSAVASGDSVVFTQKAAFANVPNPTVGNNTGDVRYDGSGVGVVSVTGTDGSAGTAATPATKASFTVNFGNDTVLPSSYTFDSTSVPVLVGETGANIGASFASAFTVGAPGSPVYDVVAYAPGSPNVTFTATATGPVVPVTSASFVGANIPNTTFGVTSFVDRLDFTSYAVKAVFVGATLVKGVAPILGETYIQMTESTTNAGEYKMTQFTENAVPGPDATDVAVGIIGIADFGATQPFVAANFVI